MNSLFTYSITFPSYFSCLLFFSSPQALSLFYYSLYYPSIVWLFLRSYLHAWYDSFFLPFCFWFFFNGLPMCISIKVLLYNKSWGPAAQGNRYRTWLGRQLDYNQISVSGETKLQCNFKLLGGQNPQNGLLFTTYCS